MPGRPLRHGDEVADHALEPECEGSHPAAPQRSAARPSPLV